MRDPTIRLWDIATFPIGEVEWEMVKPYEAGPDPLDGGEPQFVVSDNGRWRFTYHGVTINADNVHAFRALMARHRGRGALIYISPYDRRNGPVYRVNGQSVISTKWSDGTTWSDGTQWAESISDCVLSADVVQGATQIPITNSVLAPLKVGDFFELDGRVHMIEDLTGGVATVWPQLRKAHASGTMLEIADPRLLAFLSLDTPAFRSGVSSFGQLSLTFQEERW